MIAQQASADGNQTWETAGAMLAGLLPHHP
jgi:hypothetical protein